MAQDIERKLAVVNGFVEIPDGQRTLKTKLTPDDVVALIPGSSIIRVGSVKSHDQEWVQLPAFDSFEGPPSDFFQTLRDAAAAV